MGKHGALTEVHGRENWGEVGEIYPTIWRGPEKSPNASYQYIGHYKVKERVIMPISIWKQYAKREDVVKRRVISEVGDLIY